MLERVRGKTNLSDLLLFLKITGLWYDFKSEKYVILQKLRYVYFSIVFIVMNVSITRDGIRSAISNRCFFLVSAGYYVFIQGIIYYFYRDKIKSILEKLKRLHEQHTEQWQREMFAKQSNTVWVYILFYSITAINFILFYYIAPCLYDLYLVNSHANVEDGYIFSLSYPLEEIRKHDRDFMHYALLVISLVWSFFLESYGMGSLALQTVTCSYACIEIRIIRRLLEKGGKLKLLNNRKFLKEIITRHNAILSLVVDGRAVIGPAVATQIGLGALILSAFLCTIMEIEHDMSLTITYIVLFGSIALLFFTFCLFGEMLQTQGNILFECLCGIPWDEMTPQTRKDFNMILLQAKKPIQISYQGLLPVNFESFQFVMNSSYSFLMLLNSTK